MLGLELTEGARIVEPKATVLAFCHRLRDHGLDTESCRV